MATAIQSISPSQDLADMFVPGAPASEQPPSLLGEWSFQTGNLASSRSLAERTLNAVRRHPHRRITQAIVQTLRTQARQARSAQELHWIASHGREYAGQWVALAGDQMLAHGCTGREVFAAVAHLAERPLVIKIDEQERLPFGGW